MINRQRTIEIYGYDIDPNKRRRVNSDFVAADNIYKRDLLVVDNCPSCNEERHIKLRASKNNKPCIKCFHRSTIAVEAKKNNNKPKSEETKRKMKENNWHKSGFPVPFKGSKHTEEAKDKLRKAREAQFSSYTEEYKLELRKKGSCTARGIKLEQFEGFSSPEKALIRQSSESKKWIKEVLTLADFTCVKCKNRGGDMHAHHKNAFAKFPEQRFDIANGACLCIDCHAAFHSIYGKGDNTENQFNQWLSLKPPVVYLVCGVSGSGKSWVCKQLTDKYRYISFDENKKSKHVSMILDVSDSRPILHDLPIKISTFIKRNSSTMDIRPVFIIESEETLKTRLSNRGGKWTESAAKRMQAINARSKKYGVFSGSSTEVLQYLSVNELQNPIS